ncbi:hypothetical protein N7931_14825 [Catenovulum sp. 2E275]|uniref:hypothetical protein n=1 Tax=Catenovulum sp. 2E275 TaxID=2980497 RepID=UPI0021D395B0|nr:hypothetical protein [Catenovulum sp. 2E275]MCU4676905.1 hypothetical protein [Catenovulum sp. 2E275]
MLQQQDFAHQNERLLDYAQLCNVFYERELKLLAECQLSPEYVAKRLSSLPFYIKRAAEAILSLENPLTLDAQNGTWSAKQKRKSPADKITPEQNQSWLEKNAQLGLVVVVIIYEKGQTHFRLDCIDVIEGNKIRLNEHGWFNFSGNYLESSLVEKRLIKSTKDIMTAACCGHQWIGNDMTFPRTLTLRELLLTTVINWTNLNKPLALTH